MLFDIEVVFLYPWAIIYKQMLHENAALILRGMVSFLRVLFVGFLYALKSARLIGPAEARARPARVWPRSLRRNGFRSPPHLDYLVLGSGIAGLNFAPSRPERTRRHLHQKRTGRTPSTNWAQGGIASVTSREEFFALHVQDTLEAGAGLCREGGRPDRS